MSPTHPKGKPPKLIAPSVLSADFANLGAEVRAVEQAGADWVHVDVMDGHFVPNITIGPLVVAALRRETKLPLDVHLMIEDPDKYLEAFVKAGADYVTVHEETLDQLHPTVSRVRELGARAGVSINPATPVSRLHEILPHVDLVLIMTVNPGFGGQKFMPDCVEKVRTLARLRSELSLKFLIEADGGISAATAGEVSAAGCDVFVAGSAIFGTGGAGQKAYAAAMSKIRSVI